jgi:hypothetical protein
MAPFDGITRNRVIVTLWMALGIVSLYHGFTTPIPSPVFGVDVSVWLGIGFIMTGIIFWYEFRSKQNSTTSD